MKRMEQTSLRRFKGFNDTISFFDKQDNLREHNDLIKFLVSTKKRGKRS